MNRKLTAILLCLILAVCCLATFAACNDEGNTTGNTGNNDDQEEVLGPYEPPADKTDIVYLGDSIAEGILGASPLGLRHEYAYANVLGRRNDYQYYNHSVSGHLTKDLLAILQNEDLDYDGARGLLLHVKEADVIHISILGNDVLQDRKDGAFESAPVTLHNVILEAAEGKYDSIDRVLNGYTNDEGVRTAGSVENLKGIVDRLRELNPDAPIIFQAVYNPIMDVDTPLIKQETRAALEAAEFDITLENLHDLGERLITRLNGALDTVLQTEGYEDAFLIADGHEAFNEVYAADSKRAKDLIYPDGIHPSNEGHAVLADKTQELLEELGLADEQKAVAEYKAMRKNVVRQYFAATADVAAAEAAIDAATDCAGVTEAFFDATRGQMPDYSEVDYSYAVQEKRPADDYDISFAVDWDNTSIWGMTLGDVGGMLDGAGLDPIISIMASTLIGGIDEEASGATVSKDGKLTISLKFSDKTIEDLNALLDDDFPQKIGEMLASSGFDLNSFVNTYLEPIMPGFVPSDPNVSISDNVAHMFDLAATSLGMHITGEGDMDAFLTNLAKILFEGGEGVTDFKLPKGFGITIESTYTMRPITYPDGTVYKGIILTPSDVDSQSYLVLTMEGEKGSYTLNAMLDFIKLDLNLTERQA